MKPYWVVHTGRQVHTRLDDSECRSYQFPIRTIRREEVRLGHGGRMIRLSTMETRFRCVMKTSRPMVDSIASVPHIGRVISKTLSRRSSLRPTLGATRAQLAAGYALSVRHSYESNAYHRCSRNVQYEYLAVRAVFPACCVALPICLAWGFIGRKCLLGYCFALLSGAYRDHGRGLDSACSKSPGPSHVGAFLQLARMSLFVVSAT